MHFIEKIENGIYPSKEDIELLFQQGLTCKEICEKFNISISTYKKLKKYYNISKKKRIVCKESYKGRGEKISKTMELKYGPKGSETRKKYYEQRYEKTKKTYKIKYGVENPGCLSEILEKRKQTCIMKYGVDNPMKVKEIQKKAQQTDFIKYGQKFHIASDSIRQKINQSLIQKFGTLNFQSTKEVTRKRESTNLNKYGAVSPFGVPELRKKAYETMLKNGKQAVLTSSQQIYINKLYNGQLNYLFEYYHADMYLIDDNIVVEYSGRGHDLSVRLNKESREMFDGKEKARKNYFKNRNIPVLELVSKTDKLPKDEILLNILEEAKQLFKKGVLYYKIDLDAIN